MKADFALKGLFMMPIRKNPLPASAKSRRRWLQVVTDPTSWVIFCGMAIITAIIVGTAFVVINFRERALQRSEFELENATRILAQHFDRRFDGLSAAEQFIAGYLERQGLSPADYGKVLASDSFLAVVKTAIGASADNLSRMSLFDRDGALIISSDARPNLSDNISDRAFFKALKHPSSSAIRTRIELIDDPSPTEKRIVIARRIAAPDGQTLGIVALTVLTEQLDRFLTSVALKDRTILLVGNSVDVLARFPHHRPDEATFPDAAMLDRLIAAGSMTTQLSDSQTGSQQIVSTRRLVRYPLTVITATSVAAALDSWSDETRTLLLVAGMTGAVICVMLIAIVRHLKEQTRRLDVAINNIPQAILMFDPQERLIVKNSRYAEVIGPSEHVGVGRRFKDIIGQCRGTAAFPHLETYCDSVREALWQKSRTQKTLRISDGRFLQVVNQALDEGGWVSTIEDVTERHRTQELTVRLAQYDSLTGLPNRASFQNHLRAELAGLDQDDTLAVLFLDLDEFKTVNDTLGHHIGDQLLKAVASELKVCLEPGEFVARLGGDEFAIVYSPICDNNSVLQLAERICDAVRRPHDCAGHTLAIEGSIGIALAPADGKTSDSILQSADLAMYAAKAQGKKAYRFFEPKMEADARERLRLELDLRNALAECRIETYFQPIYDLRQQRIVACEALARWRHPQRGLVSPMIFIPIAEQSGLIVQLGDVILRQACHAAVSWPNDIAVAVNVSAIQLRNPVFALKVLSALHDSGLPARRLEIEITEAVLIGDDETSLRILHELRAIGVRIALDDFGTGYSALSYLLRFPFDKLKIDRCFIEGLTEQDRSREIVKATIMMASELHMVTTAEGVETDAQREVLEGLGCDQIQGHLISPAVESQRIYELLTTDMAAVTTS
jgi:diguanylate cyclase (GGDEF)-like protein